MRRELAVIGVAVVLISTTVGVSAYTTGTVNRESTVDVVSDTSGLIGLNDGTSGDLVQINSSNQLEMNFTTSAGATGANVNAHFELGNPNDPTNQTAFNVTNNDAETHDITFSYSADSPDNDGDTNLEFRVYDSSGTLQGTATEEGDTAKVNSVGSGSTLYVVVVVDTQGMSTTNGLSGTLTITADN